MESKRFFFRCSPRLHSTGFPEPDWDSSACHSSRVFPTPGRVEVTKRHWLNFHLTVPCVQNKLKEVKIGCSCHFIYMTFYQDRPIGSVFWSHQTEETKNNRKDPLLTDSLNQMHVGSTDHSCQQEIGYAGSFLTGHEDPADLTLRGREAKACCHTPTAARHRKCSTSSSNKKNIMHLQLNARWWFQPIWKILVKLDHLPRDRGENNKYLSCHHLEWLVVSHCTHQAIQVVEGLPLRFTRKHHRDFSHGSPGFSLNVKRTVVLNHVLHI